MEKQCILIPFLKATFINLENDCYLPASFYWTTLESLLWLHFCYKEVQHIQTSIRETLS